MVTYTEDFCYSWRRLSNCILPQPHLTLVKYKDKSCSAIEVDIDRANLICKTNIPSGCTFLKEVEKQWECVDNNTRDPSDTSQRAEKFTFLDKINEDSNIMKDCCDKKIGSLSILLIAIISTIVLFCCVFVFYKKIMNHQ